MDSWYKSVNALRAIKINLRESQIIMNEQEGKLKIIREIVENMERELTVSELLAIHQEIDDCLDRFINEYFIQHNESASPLEAIKKLQEHIAYEEKWLFPGLKDERSRHVIRLLELQHREMERKILELQIGEKQGKFEVGSGKEWLSIMNDLATHNEMEENTIYRTMRASFNGN